MSFDSSGKASKPALLPAPDAVVNATDVLSEHLQKPRRRAEEDENAPRKTLRLRLPVWLIAVCAFGMGTTTGVLVMKKRQAADRIIVAVNGETIRSQEFYQRLETAAGPQMLHQMVTETLTRQYARQRQVLPAPAEIQSRAAQIGAQAAFAAVAAHPLAPEQAQQMAQAQSVREQVVSQGVDAAEGETRAYYQAQTDPHNPAARFFRPEAVRLAVIVTPTEAQAQQAYAALRGGTAFSTVAKTYSKDRSAAQGGELAPILRGRTAARQVRGLEEFVFGLQPGQTTRPQKLLGAWWIASCLDKTPSATLPFAHVRAQCQQEARLLKAQRLQGERVEAEFEKYCRSVPVQVFWGRYAAAALNQEHRLNPDKL